MFTFRLMLGLIFIAGWAWAEPWAPVRVSDSGTHLETAEGETFIWLGDTAWELFHKLNREEAIEYLDNRAAKGFTVVQAVVLAELDGLRTPNAYGHLPLHELDPARPNETYFEHVDFIIEAAAKRGLVIGLLPTWGDKLPSTNGGAGPLVFTPENAAAFGTFLGHRYAGRPLVWILGGDRDPDVGNATEIWHAMAHAIKSATGGGQLMTYHPRGWSTSARFFPETAWLDFHMFQSGHETGIVPMDRLSEETMAPQPQKPFVNGEPAYEDIAIRFWEYMDFSQPGSRRVPAGVLNSDGLITQPDHFAEGFVTAGDVRRQAYMAYLLGATGYTYGNNAIWQMFKLTGEIALPTLTDWREAMDRPGAQAMRHVRALWESRPLGTLRPAGDAIVEAPPEQSGYPLLAARTTDGSFMIVQFPHGGTASIDVSSLRTGAAKIWWYNPRDGTHRDGGKVSFREDDTLPITSPTKDVDWLLIIDAIDADYGPPGDVG